MVPVLDYNNIPLMPCSEKRARKMMEKGKARPHYQKGIFCIKLCQDPSSRSYQDVALGIDPGSKREGYTLATKSRVILNITANTPYWVKDKVETRKNLRRARRYRKTPYRKCRPNRRQGSRYGFIGPSTKSRWQAKLRVLDVLKKIIPVTVVNVEDIKARARKGKSGWNKSFSPLQVGKKWFNSEIKKRGLSLIITPGYETCLRREYRQLKKSKDKLCYSWESHNIDSHVLVEIALGQAVNPSKGLYKIEFHNRIRSGRRQLHLQIPSKGNKRRRQGGTVTFGHPRDAIYRYVKDDKLYFLGGYREKNRNKKCSIKPSNKTKRDNRRRCIDIGDMKLMYTCPWQIEYLAVDK